MNNYGFEWTEERLKEFSEKWHGKVRFEQVINEMKDKYAARIPLFKTEDGVDVFECDTVFVVFPQNGFGLSKWAAGYWQEERRRKLDDIIKAFSTEAAANEYIAWNKPHISVKEIVDRFFTNRSIDILNYSKQKLKQ